MPFHKQPLVHFVVIGLLIFAVYKWINPESGDANQNSILIDNGALLEYLQYRNRTFDARGAQTQLAELAPVELQDLKERLIREDALYREALKLQLDQNDYIIKQRLVQKMEYLARGFPDGGEALSREAVATYFEQNRQRYNEPATLTFTHVFINPQLHGEKAAKRQAIALLDSLRENDVPFSEATRYGDRFLYHANYVERSADFIDSHFGADFTRGIMEIGPDGSWQGPIASSHGLHLVKVIKRQAGGVPPLQQIYDRVAHDARTAWLQAQTDAAVRRIIDSYEVLDRVNAGDVVRVEG